MRGFTKIYLSIDLIKKRDIIKQELNQKVVLKWLEAGRRLRRWRMKTAC